MGDACGGYLERPMAGFDPRSYAIDDQVRDGTFVHVRAIRPDDRERLHANFRRLSAETVRSRFLGAKGDLTEDELDRYTRIEPERHVGLVATVWDAGAEKIVGVGRYFVDEGDGPTRAEVAFTVDDAYQDRGIGTLLFDHLVEVAGRLGVDEVYADAFADNERMLGIFERSGLPMARSRQGGGVVRIRLDLNGGRDAEG